MDCKKILITTPDYPPEKVGGISTFVLGIEKIIKSLGFDCEVFIWNNITSIQNKDLNPYDVVINAHFKALLFQPEHSRIINFIHGAEILSFSKNPLKYFAKILLRKKLRKQLVKSHFNICVSEYTLNLLKKKNGTLDFSNTMVFENCIEVDSAKFIEKDFNQKLILCCFVRDVPHKNIKGVIQLFKYLKEIHPFGATLYLTSDKFSDEDIHPLINLSDNSREQIYKAAHLNLLLSLDHSSRGHVEGFGLTVLEAGKYGVPTIGLRSGGLINSIHEGETGLFLDKGFDKESVRAMYSELQENYSKFQTQVYQHTHFSHDLNNYKKLFEMIL